MANARDLDLELQSEGFPKRMTQQEVATAARVTPRTVRRWEDRGLERIGSGHPRYLRIDVAQFFAARD